MIHIMSYATACDQTSDNSEETDDWSIIGLLLYKTTSLKDFTISPENESMGF